jgi:hypothetical protein
LPNGVRLHIKVALHTQRKMNRERILTSSAEVVIFDSHLTWRAATVPGTIVRTGYP